jgi:hypothetical protein
MQQESLSHRFPQSLRSYRDYLRSIGLFGGLTITAMTVWTWWGDLETMFRVFRSLAVVAVVVGALLTALMFVIGRVYAVTIDSRGIRTFNVFGGFKTVPWESISKVHVTSMTGVTYFVMKSSETRLALYVPVDLKDSDRFGELVIRFAGSDHPLSRWVAPDEVAVA